MKTIIEQKTYGISEIDESGLIPEGVPSVRVDYNPEGKPEHVQFYPRLKSPGYDGMDREERINALSKYADEIEEDNKKLNPPRTQEERERIANLLESSLQNSQ